MKQSGFTLMELLVVMAILGILVVAGLGSFSTSQKKSRDIKRKNDLRQMTLALETYYNDFGQYPMSDANHIPKGCGAGGAASCTWGSVWSDVTPDPDTIYMISLPSDPTSGRSYYYDSSDGSYFKIYALLENTLDTDTGVRQAGYSGTTCSGVLLCTYGVSSANAAL